MATTPRHYNGLVSRFSAGQRSVLVLPPDLADSLKQLDGTGSKLHCCGVNLTAQDVQTLIGLLRHRGVEVTLDRLVSAPGDPFVIFQGATVTIERATALATAANRTPANKKVIDCEGYAYMQTS